jgi:hypothetical protein
MEPVRTTCRKNGTGLESHILVSTRVAAGIGEAHTGVVKTQRKVRCRSTSILDSCVIGESQQLYQANYGVAPVNTTIG